jgi:hypothetical protein
LPAGKKQNSGNRQGLSRILLVVRAGFSGVYCQENDFLSTFAPAATAYIWKRTKGLPSGFL